MRRTILLICSCLAAGSAGDLDEGKRWWTHIQFLADDKLEGRNTGSPGHKQAADYIAAQFERAGLKAAGVKGYIQPVPFRVSQIDESRSSVEIVRNGKIESVKLGDEVTMSPRSNTAPAEELEAVFVGHGLTAPDVGYDDLAGLDLKGKLAVYLTGGPSTIPGNLKSHFSSGAERWRFMKRAGVVGLIRIDNPKSMDVPWARQSANRLLASMALADANMDEATGLRYSLSVNPERAQRFFDGTGRAFAELLALADADKPLPKFPLAVKFRLKTGVAASTVESQNVVAYLEGSDPKLRAEHVVLSAHLDHLGTARSVDTDRVFNGAMDNASGVAWLIETARRLRASKPKRSLIFVAVTGEEKGLQGSRYFAANPSVKDARMVANINMDMVLPLFPLRYLEVQGLGESTLGADIRAVCAELGIEPQFDKEPDRNRFIRSDQYSFIKRGVPALAFKFGWTPGSPEEKIYKDWYRDRYHGVRDDLDQPVDLEGAGKFTRVLESLLLRVANGPARPAWNADSFFKRFAAAQAP